MDTYLITAGTGVYEAQGWDEEDALSNLLALQGYDSLTHFAEEHYVLESEVDVTLEYEDDFAINEANNFYRHMVEEESYD